LKEAQPAGALYPIYIRAQAYLAGHQASEVGAEFHKIIDHRGIVVNEPIGALAHLGLARAYALQGDNAKAQTKYQDFFALWKYADPDIPILIVTQNDRFLGDCKERFPQQSPRAAAVQIL
jgi:eukaryotic-like serine/threonine-protein kinase